MTAQVQTSAPTVTTGSSSNISTNSVTLAGNITATGGANSTERGFFVSTTSGFADGTGTKFSETGSYGTGAFSLSATGLSPSTVYYFKAFATSPNGTSYGSQGTFTTADATASNPPTLAVATVATVDGAFDVTFTDDPAWRSGITSITVDGVSLTAGWSASEAGKITFTPSASVPTTALQAPGTKSIVIKSTGYLDASMSQTLGVGQASQLVVATQPAAPAFNGLILGAQPVVALQDQYGNATTSTSNVTAAVGAGTWTLGGTVTVAAVNGTATFSGLTATSAAAVTGATISFTSGSLAGATSSTFNIPAPLVPGEVLISQVYGAGGNTGATYNQDYVELYNPGSVDKDLAGWSIQYASNTGTTWIVQSLNGTIKAGKYFLVSLASGTIGSGLPTPDFAGIATGAGAVNLSGSNGKVALANTTTPFTTAFPTGSVDFVGYGTATSFEGSAAAPAPSATTAIFRAGSGATDSNNNGADFSAAAPNPRNSTFGEAVGSITLNPTSITNLTAPVGGVSAVQSYVVVGTNLGTTNLVVTPSMSLIEVSTNALTGFSTNAISFVPSAGVVSNTIYVRVTNSTATNYAGTIANVSGTASANLPVSGTIYALAEFFSMASGNYTETFSNIASWTTPTTGSWQGLVAGGTNTIPVATNITTATLGFAGTSATGVQRGTENLQFLTTGSTDNSTSIGLDLLLNFTGRKAGTLSFDAAMVVNSTGDRVSTLRVYASANGVDWAEVTGGGLPFLSTNNVAGSASVSVSLPSSLDNASQGRLRFYVQNGTGGTGGSRPKISIDNVAVTSTVPVAAPSDLSYSPSTINGFVGQAISSLTPTVTGTVDTYSVSPSLPAGLSINPTSGVISGTPLATASSTYTVTAANAGGSTTTGMTIQVSKGTPIIIVPPTAPALTAGQALSASTLAGGSASVPGTFDWTSPSTVPGSTGSYGVTFTPTDTANYNTATTTVSVAVNAADPLADYLASFNLTGADALGTADPDGDGMNNNAEFAFGTSPVSGASRAATLSTGTGSIKLTYLQRDSGVTYTVKSLPDLATAFDSGTTVTPSVAADQTSKPSGYTRYEATVNTGSNRGFLRVKAVAP